MKIPSFCKPTGFILIKRRRLLTLRSAPVCGRLNEAGSLTILKLDPDQELHNQFDLLGTL